MSTSLHAPIHLPTISTPSRRHASPQPASSPASTHTGISSIAHLDRGTQIGIIVGITVIAILVVIGCGLGVVGFRRRQRRRRRRLQAARDEELAVLEGEMKRGGDGAGAGHKRGQGSAGSGSGLWDNLKIRCGEERGVGAIQLGRVRDGREGSVDTGSEAGLVKPPAAVHFANASIPPSSVAVGGSHT